MSNKTNIIRKNFFLYNIFLSLIAAGCATMPSTEKVSQDAKILPRQAVLPLPNCNKEMECKEYWLAKPEIDKKILTKKMIEEINKDTYKRGLLTDIFSDKLWDYKYREVERPEEVNPGGEEEIVEPEAYYSEGYLEDYTLYTFLKEETERIKAVTRWDENSKPISKIFFEKLDNNMNIGAIQTNNHISYALTRRRSNLRYYPTDKIMTSKPGNINFDIIQVSSIRALQPVAILHASKDEKWLFVVSAYCRGWIRRKNLITECYPEEIKKVINTTQRLVVIGHKIEAYWSLEAGEIAEFFYLGASLPFKKKYREYYEVLLPVSSWEGKIEYRLAYVKRGSKVKEGFLPCTERNIYSVGFDLLHTPYEWGGRGEYRDCSQLVMDLYATMGLAIPRNSGIQAKIGQQKITFKKEDSNYFRSEKLKTIKHPCLLQLPGHIMLYLGCEGNNFYVLHDIWSYREKTDWAKDRRVIIGKVVVSDLSLGQGSNRGSLLERLTTINLVRP